MTRHGVQPIIYGTLASALLFVVYGLITGVVSGPRFVQEQFIAYWYFITALAAGFGLPGGLYIRLKELVMRGHGGGVVLGVTGTTSTAAMVSCCAHYLANILPILGVAGVVTFVAEYQAELFWVGIIFNIGGVLYIVNRIFRISARQSSALDKMHL